MEEAGLAVREDVMGNIYGRWQGSYASAGGDLVGLISVQVCALCFAWRTGRTSLLAATAHC